MEERAGGRPATGRGRQREEGHQTVETFLHELANIRVLDPACGSGNFLYVTLELLKRLEGEVLNTLHELGAPPSWSTTRTP
jgi:hypothetical protein